MVVSRLVITGQVLSGLGRGGGFVALEWVRREILQKFGFEPYPGTLNLKVLDLQSRKNLEIARSLSPITIESPTADFCSAPGVRASVEGMPAALIFPEATVHEEVIVEVVAALHIRSALSLQDGDLVHIETEIGGSNPGSEKTNSVDFQKG